MTGKPDPIIAKRLAQFAHAGQEYGHRVPYEVHLEAVVGVGARFGLTDPTMVCAFWTHDTIEDTGTSYGDLFKELGEEVAELVFCVSSELGRDRHDRNLKTYPKISANLKATMLKLVDRIANVEYGLANGGKTAMYEAEFEEFHKALYYKVDGDDGVVLERLWNHLARLLNKR